MPHEIEKEALSAFLDRELAPAEHARIQAHLAACADCQSYLSRLSSVSGMVKRHALRPLPPTVEAVAAAEVKRARKHRLMERVTVVIGTLAAALLVLIVGGMAMKKAMPGLFSQIQGMISGAAASLGQ